MAKTWTFRSVAKRGVVFSLLLLAIGSVDMAQGQLLGPDPQWLRLGGSVGFEAEGYRMQGIVGRRAPATLRLFARTSFSVLGFRSGLQLLYSTDESQLRQSMNRIGFSAARGWVAVAFGDVTPSFTRYSLQGVTVRGGMVELTPGAFTLSLVGGQSQRAVEADSAQVFRRPTFQQMLYGLRIGYGRRNRSRVYLNVVYGRDRAGSLKFPGEVKPAENLTLTPEVGLSLLRGRFVLEGQFTATAFTRDHTQPLHEDEELPWYLRLVTPSLTTRYTYAGEGGLRLDLGLFALDAHYSRVQPGFKALGVPRLRDDQSSLQIRPRFSLLGRRLTIAASFAQTRNNLLGHRTATVWRNQWGLNVQIRPARILTLSGSYLRLDNENRPKASLPDATALRQQQTAETYMLMPTLLIQQGLAVHTISLSGTYQRLADQRRTVGVNTPAALQVGNTVVVLDRSRLHQSGAMGISAEDARVGSEVGVSIPLSAGSPPLVQQWVGSDTAQGATLLDSKTATLNYTLSFATGFSLNLSGNVLHSTSAPAEVVVKGLTLGAGYRFKRLHVDANGGWSQSQVRPRTGIGNASSQTAQINVTARLSYRVLGSNQIRLQLRQLVNRTQSGGEADFSELQITLRYEHRF